MKGSDIMKNSQEMTSFCIDNSYTSYKLTSDNNISPHFKIIEKNLSENEDVIFAFVSNGIKNRKGNYALGGTMAVALTAKKIICAQRRPIAGDFIKKVPYDKVFDVSSKVNWHAGEIVIDSITEYMCFNVEKARVEEIQQEIHRIVEDYRIVKKATNEHTSDFSIADELLKFKELLDMGIITQEEFEAKKKQLLAL